MSGECDLVAERLLRAIDLLRVEMRDLHQQTAVRIAALEAELVRVRDAQAHQGQFHDHRLSALEKSELDHEQRLRLATDGVTQFKVWSGLAAGGSGVVSLFALLRTWFS
jgi:hypothetical protein